MSNIRHLLRLHTQKRTQSEIIEQTGISRKVLKKHIKDFKESRLSFEEINELTDKDLEELFLKPDEPRDEKFEILFKMFPKMAQELTRKGVSRKLLWKEYKSKYPNGFGRSQFNSYFAAWKAQAGYSMHNEQKAGDKMYIDFAGDKMSIIDKATSTIKYTEVFVAILGSSQLTYVEAVMSQKMEDFIPTCENALHFYGGVPAAIVCDNLRAAVTKSSKYEPVLNETFADFAEHYNTTILPARPYKPKDKALVEIVINIIYSRIYAKLRDVEYYSLEELNSDINIALEEHNNEVLTGKDYSRRQKFNEEEQRMLLPLPMLRYEFKKQYYATVTRRGYVSLPVDKHYYSVPYSFIGKKVKVMYSRHYVEMFYKYESIAKHKRERISYKYTTENTHLHPSHRFVKTWGADRFLKEAEAIHKDVRLYMSKILSTKQHPEQAYKKCIGILGFAKKVGNERLTKACQRALYYGIYNYKIIKKILEKGLDKDIEENEQLKMPQHNNIRGKDYYK